MGSTGLYQVLVQDLKDMFDLEDHNGAPAYDSYEECADRWFARFPKYAHRGQKYEMIFM